jgi:hypothetical protein
LYDRSFARHFGLTKQLLLYVIIFLVDTLRFVIVFLLTSLCFVLGFSDECLFLKALDCQKEPNKDDFGLVKGKLKKDLRP